MDLEKLQQIIAYLGGENKIAGFVFDNSGRRLFEKDFSLAKYLIPDTEVLVFVEKDGYGNTFKVFKAVSDIQTVIGVDDVATIDHIDTRFISM